MRRLSRLTLGLFVAIALDFTDCARSEAQTPSAAAASPATRFIAPTWFEPIVLPAYSEAIRAGGQLFVSGMTGITPGTQEIISGGVGAQTRQTLENIRTLLPAAGATMAQITECTVFLVDMADYAAMNGAYIEFFHTALPARSHR